MKNLEQAITSCERDPLATARELIATYQDMDTVLEAVESVRDSLKPHTSPHIRLDAIVYNMRQKYAKAQ